MIPKITLKLQRLYVLPCKYFIFTESKAFLNHAIECTRSDNFAVPCRGHKFGTFPDEEELESTWGKKYLSLTWDIPVCKLWP